MRAHPEFHDVASQHQRHQVAGGIFARAIARGTVLQHLRHLGQRHRAFGHEVNAVHFGGRRNFRVQPVERHPDGPLQEAGHDAGRGAAADDLASVERPRQLRQFAVAFLAKRRAGDDQQPSRMTVINHAAGDVVLRQPVVVDEGFRHQLAGQLPRGNFILPGNLAAQKFNRPLLSPAQRQAFAAQAGLADAVGKINNPVAELRVEFAVADDAILPFFQRDAHPFQRQRTVAAQQDQRRVAVFDHAGFAVLVEVHNRERRIADLALLANRQGVHDRPGAFPHVHKRGGVAQRHRRREIRQHARLHAAAQAVGKHGDDPALLLDFPRKEDVAGNHLAALGLLAEINVYKAFAIHGRPSARRAWAAKRNQ